MSALFPPRCAPLALAMALAFASLPALSQTAAPVLATQAYNLPAQPLNITLARIASSSGVRVSVDSELVRGLQAHAVQGQLTPEAALQQALVGSGLELVRTGSGVLTLRRAAGVEAATTVVTPEGSAPVLATTHVQATAERNASTEGSGSWSGRSATIGKSTQSLREIPQSVSVITRERMDAQGLRTLDQALGASTGVTITMGDPDRMSYNVRGHSVDTLQFDGMAFQPSPDTGGMLVQTDMLLLDRIEVLRGSAGLLQGSGNPSASINMVRKRPLAEFAGSAALTVGRWDQYRAEADISAPLVASGKVRGRLVVANDDKKTFQDYYFDDRKTVYGVVEADLTPSTRLTVGATWQDQKTTGSWYGLPASPRGDLPWYLPRSTKLGGAWNRWSRDNTSYFAELEHSFDNEWKLKANLTYAEMHLYDFRQSYYTGNYDPLTGRGLNISTGSEYDYMDKQKGLELTASGPVQLFGRKHELVFGASQRDGDVRTDGGGLIGPNYNNANPYVWNPAAMYDPPRGIYNSAYNNRTRFDQKAIYGMARLHVTDPLKVILGARVSWYDYDKRVYNAQWLQTSRAGYKIDREVTPYAGVVYELDKATSLYASYADIFQPQNNIDRYGEIIDPRQGASYEIGIKRDLFEGRAMASLAIFRIDEKNRAQNDVDGPSPCPHTTGGTPGTYCSIATGETRSEGFELELSGELMKGLQAFAGYTYNSTTMVRDRNTQGQPLSSRTPRHLLRVAANYRLPGELGRWSVGGGVNVQSRTYNTGSGRVVMQGGYAVTDLHAQYRITPSTSVSMNVSNLFDRTYFRAIATGAGNFYGEPRKVSVTLRSTF
ncbi:TonB-dependent receptor [Xenophilus sp. Marseille-Q4582]|uniref:TonB-dependent siderophore receptor n=1 Tax=Xenophilus sp. Marseille-Q4582 TaxID=2866600 RepID=UPI001CE43163|nr:TonB-dependent receptor [Xenophilus sp. Marseille-Q4582]